MLPRNLPKLSFFERVSIHSARDVDAVFTFISETRRTYRAILSEPRIVIPEGYASKHATASTVVATGEPPQTISDDLMTPSASIQTTETVAPDSAPVQQQATETKGNGKKRALEEDTALVPHTPSVQPSTSARVEESSKKKRRKNASKDAKIS